jgi:hypothetical protein
MAMVKRFSGAELTVSRLASASIRAAWRRYEVTHPDHLPLLMKVPILHEGEDPAAIVGFEMEQMILPRLSGIHVPKFVASGDFAVQPYRDGAHPRRDAVQPDRPIADPL